MAGSLSVNRKGECGFTNGRYDEPSGSREHCSLVWIPYPDNLLSVWIQNNWGGSWHIRGGPLRGKNSSRDRTILYLELKSFSPGVAELLRCDDKGWGEEKKETQQIDEGY